MSWAYNAAMGIDHFNLFDPAFPLTLLNEQT